MKSLPLDVPDAINGSKHVNEHVLILFCPPPLSTMSHRYSDVYKVLDEGLGSLQSAQSKGQFIVDYPL